jgi:membrane dipeptidase
MSIPYFDAHCDTITKFRPLRENSCHLDLRRLSGFAPAAQVFAIWAPNALVSPVYTELVLRRLRRQLLRSADLVTICTSAAQANAAAEAGVAAAFLSVEGADLLGCSPARLRDAYAKGIRMVNITWNRDNALAGAAMGSGTGLTAKGRSFVEGCQTLGVAVDLSHISEAAFWDVLRMARRPVLASHSNAKALCDHPRNLTDAQFMALVKNGGCAGLNFYPDFLGITRGIEAVIAHADHFLSLGGQKNLCLGGDLDGIGDLPAGLRGVQDLGVLYEAMLSRNWSEKLVQDIFYHNLMRFMETAL